MRFGEDVHTTILTGGKITVEDDPVEVADNIEAHILLKRKGLT